MLLSRAAGDWWNDLWRGDPGVAVLFGTGEATMDAARLADFAPGEGSVALWRDSAAALKPQLVQAGYGEVAARLQTLQQHPDYARPLAIQMEALLWLRDASPGAGERGIAPMLDQMVGLERAHWAKVTTGIGEDALARAVAQVTAVQCVEGREPAVALVRADDVYFGPRTMEAATAVVRELAKLYGE